MMNLTFARAACCVLGGVCLSASGDEPAKAPSMSDPASILEVVRGARENVAEAKGRVIKQTMQFSDAEASKFWPIYRAYEKEALAAGDEGVQAIKRALEAREAGKFDDHAAAQIVDAYFDHENKRLAILKKYYGKVSDELSPVRGAQFVQIEHRVRIAVDTHLAAEMPLVEKTDE